MCYGGHSIVCLSLYLSLSIRLPTHVVTALNKVCNCSHGVTCSAILHAFTLEPLPARQLCCKQVLFLVASVRLSVRTKSRNLLVGNDVTW